MSRNIVCNLIYNNGNEDSLVGFEGRCDIANIIYNVEKGSGRWCSQPECSCRGYYDSAFEEIPEDEYPCNESRLFVNWDWTPGNNFQTGEPFRILDTGINKLAILTTVFRGQDERDRKIVGFFKIKDVIENLHKIVADKNQSIRLTIDEGRELNFWEYYRNRNNNSTIWRQGRFRYIDDDRVAAILHDLNTVIQNEHQKSIIQNILEEDLTAFSSVRPDVQGALPNRSVERILLKRKYGKGGESKAHKDLKNFIAENPEFIGLNKKDYKSHIEHKFISGDLVDVLFESRIDSEDAVVEIELDHVLPGIHQAIKYKVLRCSQLGIPLDSKKVKAVVVAWKFKEIEIELCTKYGIEIFKKKI
ncbi:MAG: hypothetical protein KDD26_07655 [Winogradskyella sp.]|nr:hypothetical protein [Winogradskyella sp.]